MQNPICRVFKDESHKIGRKSILGDISQTLFSLFCSAFLPQTLSMPMYFYINYLSIYQLSGSTSGMSGSIGASRDRYIAPNREGTGCVLTPEGA